MGHSLCPHRNLALDFPGLYPVCIHQPTNSAVKIFLIIAATLAALWLLAPLLPFILVMVSLVACIVCFARMLMPP
jgi:hypothetical protein